MDPNPSTLRPTDVIGTAARCIMDHRYRNLPVVDEEGRYLGVFGVNCLLRLILPKAAIIEQGLTTMPFVRETLGQLHARFNENENQPISVCMNTDIETVQPETPLVETLLILYRSRASIPVVEEGGKLAGMISYWDVGRKILSAPVE
jgi:CBS-domain-containing membrane protein